MKKGFTLIEILVAVMIITILVAMAVPMYEKTIEKSRMAEARTMLKRIYDSKMRLMDDLDLTTYASNASNPEFGFENLDFTFRCSHGTSSSTNGHITKCATKDFTFVLKPMGTGNNNFVCAARRSGDNTGVNFLYRATANNPLLCNQSSVADGCHVYGYDSEGSAWCTAGVDSAPAPVSGGGAEY